MRCGREAGTGRRTGVGGACTTPGGAVRCAFRWCRATMRPPSWMCLICSGAVAGPGGVEGLCGLEAVVGSGLLQVESVHDVLEGHGLGVACLLNPGEDGFDLALAPLPANAALEVCQFVGS